MSPRVHPFHHRPSGTWSYVIADALHGEAAIVDPVLDFDPASGRTSHQSAAVLLDMLDNHGYTLRWILETHAHADHLTAAHWLKSQRPEACVAIGTGIREVQRHFAPLFDLGTGFVPDGSQFDHLFRDDERFDIGSIEARVIATPGHTADGISYLIGDALFSGDSLFLPDSGTARCDFPGGDALLLFRSIHRLYELPDATRVFVCHDYGPGGREARCETSIGEQKRDNIHVREGVSGSDYARLRSERDATLSVPQLLLPALQINLRAGALPEPGDNGVRYLKIPLDRF